MHFPTPRWRPHGTSARTFPAPCSDGWDAHPRTCLWLMATVFFPNFYLITRGDPAVLAIDAPHQPWDFRWGYAFPSPTPHPPDIGQASHIDSGDISDNTVMAQRHIAGGGNRLVPLTTDRVTVPCSAATGDKIVAPAEVCGMDFMCECFCAAGISPPIAEFIATSIEKSSQKAKESTWSAWCGNMSDVNMESICLTSSILDA